MIQFKEFINKIFKREDKGKKARKKRLIIGLTVFFVFIVISAFVITPILAYQYINKGKIYPGVYVDGINIGGLAPVEAIDRLNLNVDNLQSRGLNFNYKNKNFKVEMITISPADPDLAYQILNFEIEEMVDQAYWYGRNNNIVINLINQLKAILTSHKIDLVYNLKETELETSLRVEFEEFETPAQNALIVFKDDNKLEVTKETSGFVIDYEKAISDFKNKLNLISIETTEFKIKPSLPQVTQLEAQKALPLVTEILKQEKVSLKYNDDIWEVSQEEFKNWLVFTKENQEVKLVFAEELLSVKLDEISLEINQPALDAKFVFAEGKVTEFQPSSAGLELEIEENLVKIKQEFFTDKKTEIDLIVRESQPKIKTGQVNEFGIKELIGVGVTDFAGSRSNRIKNIQNAVDHLNGMLIKPGEEFSAVEAIGDVTAAAGYYPEYVIKGDRTLLEYGGGLCQISTTIFRAALYSGLSITERKPHSYIVSYYNPIGMDATIYGPHPDLRFINDTGNYILIRAKVEGTKLTFEFWGASDGRQVEITEPEVYNWRSPGEPKYIENPNLAPGEKKLIEKARRGADSHFYRYITRPGQAKEEEIWRSHYGAWRAIYEIGVELTPEADELVDDESVVSEENIQ